MARRLGAAAFFQTSSKCIPDGSTASFNVFPLFAFSGLCKLAATWPCRDDGEITSLRLRLGRTRSAWLPWKWAKVYRWSKRLKRLERSIEAPGESLSTRPDQKSRKSESSAAILAPLLPRGELEVKVEGDFKGVEVLESAVFADLFQMLLEAERFEKDKTLATPAAPFDTHVRLEQTPSHHMQDASAATAASVDIGAHRIVLAMRSSYFRDRLRATKGIMRTITVPTVFEESQITAGGLTGCLRFCYNPSLDLRKVPLELLVEIQAANVLLDIEGLEDVCVCLTRLARGQTTTGLDSSGTTHLDAFGSSAAIQTAMAPVLSSFSHLADVVLVASADTVATANQPNEQQVIFHVHRAILTARSRWFAALLAGQFSESEPSVTPDEEREMLNVTIKTMSAEVLGCVLEYLYTGRCDNLARTPNSALNVLEAGNALNLQRLVTLCEDALLHLINTDNVVALCHAALFHNAQQLVAACEHFMIGKYSELERAKNSSAQTMFKELPAELRERVAANHESYVTSKEARKARQEALNRSMMGFRWHSWGTDGEAVEYSELLSLL